MDRQTERWRHSDSSGNIRKSEQVSRDNEEEEAGRRNKLCAAGKNFEQQRTFPAQKGVPVGLKCSAN